MTFVLKRWGVSIFHHFPIFSHFFSIFPNFPIYFIFFLNCYFPFSSPSFFFSFFSFFFLFSLFFSFFFPFFLFFFPFFLFFLFSFFLFLFSLFPFFLFSVFLFFLFFLFFPFFPFFLFSFFSFSFFPFFCFSVFYFSPISIFTNSFYSLWFFFSLQYWWPYLHVVGINSAISTCFWHMGQWRLNVPWNKNMWKYICIYKHVWGISRNEINATIIPFFPIQRFCRVIVLDFCMYIYFQLVYLRVALIIVHCKNVFSKSAAVFIATKKGAIWCGFFVFV